MLAACGVIAPQASAQYTRFAIKGYDNIGLGKSMSINESQMENINKTNYNAFGLDFGWTFWHKNEHSLEANLGIGYSIAGGKFGLADMSYHYAAGPEADEDGNPYERYMKIEGMSQKTSLGYFNVPIYLEYQYRPLKWLGIHAEAGVGLGFRVHSNTKNLAGTLVTSYGVFPEYDDLVIGNDGYGDYMDGFGTKRLSDVMASGAAVKNFSASIMCGAGFEFYAYEPVSFELGIRYNAGLTNIFSGNLKNVESNGQGVTGDLPVTYTVKDGFQVNSLTDYTTKSKLNPLSLHLGINVRF